MIDTEVFSASSIIDYIRPAYLWLFFLIVLVIVFIFTKIILFHLNKYKDYSPLTDLAQRVFRMGMMILYILAAIFLILFSL